ncbi:Methyltransferase domain-containing protein [Gracilibacillus ureilyticus]|uniref:Methyltransferase domain-containing protein n=1 Tax=Gracilibacillus ureilyticus TaxID=531814 RepID=A0A1H9MVI3_9BACI|nr:class I SAM-dependent methyltransferase [Gracilibacillus ureilyticus]SER27702.1 Methyltransferase domain-containing protein [Gracilibacillus ureilyticus]
MLSYQELLDRLGMSHAHPGGRAATAKWMDQLSFSSMNSILEIGCGVGETLLSLQQRTNTEIIGLDNSKQMVNHAKKNTASHSSISVFEANAEDLPFDDEKFTLIICESALSFTNTVKSLKEISRVLTQNGKLVLLEMLAAPDLDQLDKEIIQDFYHIPNLFSRFEWLKLLLDSGFNEVRLAKISKHNKDSTPANKQILWTDSMLATIGKHYQINEQYSELLHACLFVATKTGD